jgi:hypothetical protein
MDTVTDLIAERFHMTVFNQGLNLGFFYIILPFIIKLPIIRDGLISADFPTTLITTLLVLVFVTINLNFFIDYFKIKSRIMKYLIKNKFLIKTQT